MKLYDITQELFGGNVYPGDPPPVYDRVLKMAEGAICNVTNIKLGVHNATHMDAPYHFYDEGKTIDQLDLHRCIGPCTVASLENLSMDEIKNVFKTCKDRLLVKGNTVITLEIAKLLNENGIVLVGVEGQSVGPEDSPIEVHLELLGKEVILLEGIVLSDVPEGEYFLMAAPLKLGGCDGAPCRAVLMSNDEGEACIS